MQRYSSREVDQELRALQAYLRTEGPVRQETAKRLQRLALRIAAGDDEVETGTSYDDAAAEETPNEIGRKEVQKLFKPIGKKKPNYWIPSHNFALNEALFAWNAWYFTILPMRYKATGYRAATENTPEGIVLCPMWQPFRDADWSEMSPELAKTIAGKAKAQPTLDASIREELKMLERAFKIDVPHIIRDKILKDVEKVAARRVHVNRLRVKNELWPFDGSKPILLSR